METSTPEQFYKLLINGIVYLIDPKTAIAYLFDNVEPTPIGVVHWVSQTQAPRIEFYDSK